MEDINTSGESFPDDFRRFQWFFQNANGHTEGRTYGGKDIWTDGHKDKQTHL